MLYFSGRFGLFPVAFCPCFLFPLSVRLALVVLALPVPRPPAWPLARLSFLVFRPARRCSCRARRVRRRSFGRLSLRLPCFRPPPLLFVGLARLRSRRGRLRSFAPWLPRLLPCSSAFPVVFARRFCSLRARGAVVAPVVGRSVRCRLGWVFRFWCFCRPVFRRPRLGVRGSRLVLVGFSFLLRRRCFSGGFFISLFFSELSTFFHWSCGKKVDIFCVSLCHSIDTFRILVSQLKRNTQ